MLPVRYVCPCCGHRTLERRPRHSWQLCDVCCWEDGLLELGATLAAQASFAERGCCDPELTELCRPPTPEEARPGWFFPIAEATRVLVPELREAFGDQDLDGGVNLEEAEHIDDYSLPARTLHDPPPQGFGESGPWHALTQGDLEQYAWTNFNFQDARGIRYHLPAYMRLALTAPDSPVDPTSLSWVLANGHRLEALLGLLTDAQKRVTARYLAWLAAQEPDWPHYDAREALERGWVQFLEPDQRRQFID